MSINPVHTQDETASFTWAAFDTEPLTPGVTHRQDVCHYSQKYQNGTVPLRDGLKGFALRPIIGTGDFFPYDPQTGIDPNNPGILVEMLDELAERAGFTWRESFGVQFYAINISFTDYLLWDVETYDIAIGWWDKTAERMELGISFLEPWNDGSIILIDRQEKTEQDGEESSTGRVNLFNFTKPFDSTVWWCMMFTILLSGFVYQFMEYLQGERDDRDFWQWTSDNLYLSAIGFSQNYEYSPVSAGGRIFGISMTIWALLMTATYTANLASLLVESNRPRMEIESIEQAVHLKLPICTYGNTPSDEYLRSMFSRAKLRPKRTERAAYQALQQGECEVFAASKDNWFTFKGDSRYNPQCNLDWVGRALLDIKSGFAIKADSSDKCTSFIKDVLNLHMIEMINDGVLEALKVRQRQKLQELHPTDCSVLGGDKLVDGRRRRLKTATTTQEQSPKNLGMDDHTRRLKAGSKASSSVSSENGNTEAASLSLENMLGTFVLHWGLMAIAVVVSAVTTWWDRSKMKEKAQAAGSTMFDTISSAFKVSNKQQSVPCGDEFDWQHGYYKLSAQDKALVDIIFHRRDIANFVPETNTEELDEEAVRKQSPMVSYEKIRSVRSTRRLPTMTKKTARGVEAPTT